LKSLPNYAITEVEAMTMVPPPPAEEKKRFPWLLVFLGLIAAYLVWKFKFSGQ
jgi:hypothetical protein